MKCPVWVCMYVLNYLFDLGHLMCYFKSNVDSGVTVVTLKAIVLQPLINPSERKDMHVPNVLFSSQGQCVRSKCYQTYPFFPLTDTVNSSLKGETVNADLYCNSLRHSGRTLILNDLNLPL